MQRQKPYLDSFPDSNGYFGKFGGSFIPPELEKPFLEINEAYNKLSKDFNFINELKNIRKYYQGRPTPIYFAKNISNKVGGNIYLKREDLNHTGAHKLNHCMAEALLAKYLGKKKLIAETGAGQHGVALATAAAYFGLECEIHMGEVDIKKEYPNVVKMRILGAKIVAVTKGLKTLKEAVDSAFEAYLKDTKNSMFAIGTVVGPSPFPKMVRDFQSIIGFEAREQFLDMTGKLPDMVTACVGGGSNAMGIFSGFIEDSVKLYAVEPAGKGDKIGEHSASLTYGEEGVMHGFNSIMLKDEKGEPAPVHSIGSGIDYPSVGPELAYLSSISKINLGLCSDDEAVEAFYTLSRLEGIIPALESSHALAFAMRYAKENKNESILVSLSGRGDKDIDFVIENYPLV
ncbi:Tryptophan synthase beta chain [Aliarcobacter thereius]|uniref:Tryptophan synthase beta chain n=2 Tax=Aliarcobacter thereius TaxID=544718 RepID=A0A1C0BA92_9BACT|nr:tryptophan synthase subunit beta [Aliarcobacter thereius]OCL88359.1 Tryptophan synthase beta chain [Aliarcobacter thereius]OCL91849.1 Tryptophan synthase beta chain [Aliarcobacter thereius]OCL95053.1 Tryptophan synthase beta chain [Aliarcobacter thereius LMG 24486]OCM00505.1 Tryptophan synthase beta chain [Aliarcobacter thereius]QBF16955.1 tryptophan synthase, beta subunit [Aliarcobacter thereius LMG 24486]